MQKSDRTAPGPAEAFALKMKARRAELGLSQRELADALATRGVSIDTSGITRMESGQREPRLREALAIGDVLRFSVDELAEQPGFAQRYTEAINGLIAAIDRARAATWRAYGLAAWWAPILLEERAFDNGWVPADETYELLTASEKLDSSEGQDRDVGPAFYDGSSATTELLDRVRSMIADGGVVSGPEVQAKLDRAAEASSDDSAT